MSDDSPALFRSCSMPDCERPFHARGLCKMHWRRWSRHGDPNIVNRQSREGTCSIDGCDRPIQSKGYCKRHHRRWLAYGDPTFSPRIPLCGCEKCVKLRLAEATARWRLTKDPELLRAKHKAWAQANPDRIVEAAARRRALKLSCDVREISERDWSRLCARFLHRCAYCGASAKLTQDHVVPLSRGGRHAIGNLLPVCSSCNSAKHARLLIEWRYGRRHHRVATAEGV